VGQHRDAELRSHALPGDVRRRGLGFLSTPVERRSSVLFFHPVVRDSSVLSAGSVTPCWRVSKTGRMPFECLILNPSQSFWVRTRYVFPSPRFSLGLSFAWSLGEQKETMIVVGSWYKWWNELFKRETRESCLVSMIILRICLFLSVLRHVSSWEWSLTCSS
jgi:hypothetical protein